MPDNLPPVSAKPPPTPANVPPLTGSLNDEPEEDLSHLSPFAVLKKETDVPPATLLAEPVVVPEPIPEAAKPPVPTVVPTPTDQSHSFILPNTSSLEAAKGLNEPDLKGLKVAKRDLKDDALPGTGQVLRADMPGAQPGEILAESGISGGRGDFFADEQGPQPVLSPGQPGKIVSGKIVNPGQSVTMSATDMVTPKPKRGRGALIFSLLGLVILFGLGGGVLYVLANYNGLRVPVLFTQLSKLPTDGPSTSLKAALVVQQANSYDATGTVQLTVRQDANQKPTLPNDGSTVKEVTSFKENIDVLHIDHQQKTALLLADVTTDTNTAVPVYVSSRLDTPLSNWLIYLKANQTSNLISVNGQEVDLTLLQPLLQPLFLDKVLATAQAEKGYAKGTKSGINTAAYTLTMKDSTLAGSLPKTATMSQLTATFSFVWGTAQVTDILIKGVLTYKGSSYDYTARWAIQNWNTALDAGTKTKASAVLASGAAGTAEATTIKKFISYLGLADGSIPATSLDSPPSNTIVPTPNPTQTPAGSATPTATATAKTTATPTPTPTPVTVITPSGQSISAVTTPLTATPPQPATPTSDAQKARDVQRKKDLTDLQTALDRYKTKQGNYPVVTPQEQTLSSSTLFNALVPVYLTAMPVDPLASTYWYEYSSDGTNYTLRAVAENPADTEAKHGTSFSYFEKHN